MQFGKLIANVTLEHSSFMNVMRALSFFALGLMACAAGGAMAQSGGGYVAGLHPDRRPDSAPQFVEVARTPYQLAQTLLGIEPPIPANVETIAATGNWWVPLRYPGMNAPFDLRGWHNAQQAPAAGSSASVSGSSTAASVAR